MSLLISMKIRLVKYGGGRFWPEDQIDDEDDDGTDSEWEEDDDDADSGVGSDDEDDADLCYAAEDGADNVVQAPDY